MPFPICEKCITGCLLPGEPKGEIRKTISGVDYYVASPPESKVIINLLYYSKTTIIIINFHISSNQLY